MGSPDDSSGAKTSGAISKSVPGPPYLRHYPAHRLVAWQPQGTLDDVLLDQIAEWLFVIEKVSLPFERYVDLSRLTEISVRTHHVFHFAEKRKKQFAGVESVRNAVFCDDWVGFGIAQLYESLMENTPIQVRAFKDRSKAAEWLGVPVDILSLKDEPASHAGGKQTSAT